MFASQIKYHSEFDFVIQGPCVMKGYFNNEKANADTFTEVHYLFKSLLATLFYRLYISQFALYIERKYLLYLLQKLVFFMQIP